MSRSWLTLVLGVLLISSACEDANMIAVDQILPLQGTWRLKIFELNDGGTLLAEPERYTVAFKPDGQLNARVDCNTCNGSYTENGNSLVIDPLLACTLAACPADSLEQQFLAALTSVVSFSTDFSSLTLQHDEGTMIFFAQ